MCTSPVMTSEYLQIYVNISNSGAGIAGTYCTCTALLMVPAVVFGGMMPTNDLLKSPRSKFTAPRPEFGGASSCQHSRRAALLAAEIAVRLKAVAWLVTTLTKGSTVASKKKFIMRSVRCNI
jgi:hypothetical protein